MYLLKHFNQYQSIHMVMCHMAKLLNTLDAYMKKLLWQFLTFHIETSFSAIMFLFPLQHNSSWHTHIPPWNYLNFYNILFACFFHITTRSSINSYNIADYKTCFVLYVSLLISNEIYRVSLDLLTCGWNIK